MLRWNKVLWLTISITKQLLYFSVPMLLYNFSWHQLQEMGILGVNYNSEFTHTNVCQMPDESKIEQHFFESFLLPKIFYQNSSHFKDVLIEWEKLF